MLSLIEHDEILGESYLREEDSKTKEEYIENNFDEDEDNRTELAEEWELAETNYKKYLESYEDEIGSELNGDWNNGKATCRFCGHQQEINDYDIYPDAAGTYSCNNCYNENEFEIEMEHEYAGEYTVKVIRPKCNEKSKHLWIKQKDRTDSHYYEMSKYDNKFPHKNANKYTCIKCGEDKYIPLAENGSEFSNKSIKKLNKKYREGYLNKKLNIQIRYKLGDSELRICDGNKVENIIGRVLSNFRNSIKTKYTYDNRRYGCFSFDIPNSNKKIYIDTKPYIYILKFENLDSQHEKLFLRLLVYKLKKAFNKYKVELIEENTEKIKIEETNSNLLGKTVLVRSYDNKAIFLGEVVGEKWHELVVKAKYQNKIITARKDRIELINEKIIKNNMPNNDRIDRAISQLNKHSKNWEFLKAQNIKLYLDRIGYSK